MSELRLNAATGDWVILATERAKRPEDFCDHHRVPTHKRIHHRTDCPFCVINESDEETLRYVDNEGRWTVRCLVNKFSALSPGPLSGVSPNPFERHVAGVGRHEVIVEHPHHNATLATGDQHSVALVMKAWRDRYRTLMALPETEHIILFKNHGPVAGSSLEHPHSQLVSLPVLPAQVRRRLQDCTHAHGNLGRCVFCLMLEWERAQKTRLVHEDAHFTAFVPYAAFSPCSLWILPHRHSSCFSTLTDEELESLSSTLFSVLNKFYHGLNDPDYNLVLRSALQHYVGEVFFHWYLALVPRLSKAAGFELGTGMFINSSRPEADAEFLRGIEQV